MVYIFDYEYIRNYPTKILKGDQMSSFFGSSLLVTTDELLVGAPMYTVKSFEEGCVFIYANDMQDLLFSEKICGNQMGGRFGTAMTKIGFIGMNKTLGIAISAPYAEDGIGIIYIYAKIDERYKEIEKIMGKSVSDTIRGFGFSLSNAIDVDQNNYNDFAVGSLLTDKLIVFRSRKILHFNAYINSSLDKISTSTKNISLSYCFQYTGGKDFNTINTGVFVESDARVAVAVSNRTLQTRIGDSRCEEFILMLTPSAFDSPLPLTIKISNKLAECFNCPVVYPKDTMITREIPFITGCGEDNSCIPGLNLDAHFENISSLILGTRNTVTLTTTVSNEGETAYLTKMNVTLPAQINQFPAACSKHENMLRCDISNRLVMNQTVQLQFLFDVKHLKAGLNELKIDIAVYSAGSGNGSFARATASLPITLETSIIFRGSKPEYLENKEVVSFAHEYLVFNNGPSPLMSEMFTFQIPEAILTQYGEVIYPFRIDPLADECLSIDEKLGRKRRNALAPEYVLTEVPHHIKYHLDCKSNKFVICKTYNCVVGELFANASLKFKFKIEVETSLLFDALGKETEGKSIYVIQSVANVSNNAEIEEVYSHTILSRRQIKTLKMWMLILIAAVVSLIILAVITGILYKLNFFARPMREKLLTEEEQKHERECMIIKEDKTEDDDGVFNNIQF